MFMLKMYTWASPWFCFDATWDHINNDLTAHLIFIHPFPFHWLAGHCEHWEGIGGRAWWRRRQEVANAHQLSIIPNNPCCAGDAQVLSFSLILSLLHQRPDLSSMRARWSRRWRTKARLCRPNTSWASGWTTSSPCSSSASSSSSARSATPWWSRCSRAASRASRGAPPTSSSSTWAWPTSPTCSSAYPSSPPSTYCPRGCWAPSSASSSTTSSPSPCSSASSRCRPCPWTATWPSCTPESRRGSAWAGTRRSACCSSGCCPWSWRLPWRTTRASWSGRTTTPTAGRSGRTTRGRLTWCAPSFSDTCCPSRSYPSVTPRWVARNGCGRARKKKGL